MTRRHCLDCTGNSRKCYVPSTLKSSASPVRNLCATRARAILSQFQAMRLAYMHIMGHFSRRPEGALCAEYTMVTYLV